MSAPRPYPPVTLSEGAGNGAIYGTLSVVLVITVALSFLGKKTNLAPVTDKDEYLASRNQQGVVSLTLSYFVSGMGGWVLFAVPQAACIGGWVALMFYSSSIAVSIVLMAIMAPTLRNYFPGGFTLADYVYKRYGPINAVYNTLVALFYMTLYLTAELASAGTLATGLSKMPVLDPFWQNSNVFGGQAISPILGTALVTLAYTAVGGLPVSILTDQIQGVGITLLTIIILVATYSYADDWDKDRFRQAASQGIHPNYPDSNYGDSFAVGISLFMGVTCANLFHTGYWQRVWAAQTDQTVKHATYGASFLSVMCMLLTGVTGWVAYGHYGANLIVPGAFDITFLSVPVLIRDFMGEGWCILALIFGIAMIASTCDTIQSGMTAILWPAADKLLPDASTNVKLALVITAMVFFNVPAIILALSGQSVLQLFLLADLMAATAIAPVFLGFWDRIHPAGALLGSLTGLATMLIVFAVAGHWDEGYDILVAQGGIFNRSATYAFCITPFVSAMVTIGVSFAFPGYKYDGFEKAASSTSSSSKGAASKDVELNVSSC